MSNFSLNLPGGTVNTLGGPADEYYLFRSDASSYRPYANDAEACATVPASARAARTVYVAGVEKQWLHSDTSDAGLLPKAGGGIAFAPLLTSELASDKTDYAGLSLRAVIIKLVNSAGSAGSATAPTGLTVDNSARTGTFTPAVGYALTAYEYQLRPTGGSAGAWTAVASVPFAVGNAEAVLAVRLKAVGGGNPGTEVTVPVLAPGGNNANAPALSTLRVEANNTKLIRALFNKPLDATSVPSAYDFALNTTHRVLGTPPATQTGDIQVGGYVAPSTSGPLLSGGSSTVVINRERHGRIWQRGTLKKIRFYCPAYDPGAVVTFSIYRGGQVVSAQDITSLLTNGQVSTITLPVTIAVLPDDQPALSVTNDTLGLGFVGTDGQGLPSNGGSDWGANTGSLSQSATYVSIVCIGNEAPVAVQTGDSLQANYAGGNKTAAESGFAVTTDAVNIMGAALGLPVQNMAVSGSLVISSDPNVSTITSRFQVDVLDKKPTFVVFNGGFNDGLTPDSTTALLALADRAIAANIIPIFSGGMPYFNAGSGTQATHQLLRNADTAIANYCAAHPTAIFLNMASILGDVSADGVYYTWKPIYFGGDTTHGNGLVAQKYGEVLTNVILKRSFVSVTGSYVDLLVDRAFVLSDNPVTLAFAATVAPIKSTDGGTLVSLAASPVTLAITAAAEVLNWEDRLGNNNQWRADKCFAPGALGFIDFNVATDGNLQLGVTTEPDTFDTFHQDIWQDAGFKCFGGSIYFYHDRSTYNTYPLPAGTTTLRMTRLSNGRWQMQTSPDNAAFTNVAGAYWQGSLSATYYIYNQSNPRPTTTKGLNVSAF